MPEILIIGYGNPLRGDDAVGYLAAQRLDGFALHQLTPELMEPISRAAAVIFIDAKTGGKPGAIEERTLNPLTASAAFTHHVTPKAPLAGARKLYGRCPPATLITISGSDFEIGRPLSAPVRRALETLLLHFSEKHLKIDFSTPPR